MARIRYAMSCNDYVTVVTTTGRKHVFRLHADEETAHAVSDAINRGLRVGSTGFDAGDDWARLRARAMAKQAAEMASGVRPDTGRRLQEQRRDWFERALDWFYRPRTWY